jgi:isopentenyl-diphosphate delta-isomerase
MKIPIVNEQDEILYYKEREETTRDEIRRIVSLYVFNEKNEVLIAKRHSSKTLDPNLWGPAVAGTVDEGYTYDETVVKEAEEELGLTNIQPILLKKSFYETHNARRWCARYYVVVNSTEREFVLEKDEVSEIKWISLLDLESWLGEKPQDFVPSFKDGSMANMKEIYEILKK